MPTPTMPARIPSGETVIAPGGLRYAHKPRGSQFGDIAHSSSYVHSCFLCGTHRPQNELTGRRILGHVRKVCAEPCGTPPPV